MLLLILISSFTFMLLIHCKYLPYGGNIYINIIIKMYISNIFNSQPRVLGRKCIMVVVVVAVANIFSRLPIRRSVNELSVDAIYFGDRTIAYNLC